MGKRKATKTDMADIVSAPALKPRTSAVLVGSHTLVWLILAGVTAASWAVGHGISDPRTAGVAILAMAFVKARLVIRHFMEVRDAPPMLRVITDLWIVGATALLVSLWLFAGRTG